MNNFLEALQNYSGVLLLSLAIFIGFTVIDEKAGELGKIVDVDETTVNVLLQIEYQGKDLLLPAAEDLVKHVDFAIGLS